MVDFGAYSLHRAGCVWVSSIEISPLIWLQFNRNNDFSHEIAMHKRRAETMSVIGFTRKMCSAARDCYNLSTCAMLTATTTTMQPDRMCELWVLLKYICLRCIRAKHSDTTTQQLAAAPYDFCLFHHLRGAHRWWHTGTQIIYFICKSAAAFDTDTRRSFDFVFFSFWSSSSLCLFFASLLFTIYSFITLHHRFTHVQSIQQIISLHLPAARVDVV